jgi:TPR repeat protein
MNSLRILLGAIILLTVLPAQAGVVSKVDASDTQIEKDKEVSLTFKFADSTSPIACGLSIDWGDGKIERFRVGEGQQIPPPYKINHLYSLPNNYKVRINGELLVRGLRSVPACDVKQEGTITVYDPVEAAKRAQEKSEAEKEQLARNEAEAIVRKDREEAAKVAAIAKATKDAEERAQQQVEIAKKNPTATQQAQSSPQSTGIDPQFAKVNLPDGSRYEGTVKNGKINGTGKWIYPNGDVYEGQVKNDSIEGFGVKTMANGDIYTGEFKQGKYDGQGIFVYASKDRKREGLWKNDQYQQYFQVNIAEVKRRLELAAQSDDIQAKALKGDFNAQLSLAEMLKWGWGVERNFAKSFELFKLLANKGNSVAARELAGMYWAGMGTPRNEVEAMKWYRTAAKGGDELSIRIARAEDNKARMVKMQFNIAIFCVDKHNPDAGMDLAQARYLMRMARQGGNNFVQSLRGDPYCIQPQQVRQFNNVQALQSSAEIIEEDGKRMYLVYRDTKEKVSFGLIGVMP